MRFAITGIVALAVLHGLMTSSGAAAQSDAESDETGITASALPGISKVGIPAAPAPGVMLAGTAGYGFTRSFDSIDGSQRRVRGILSGGVAVAGWLDLGLSLDGHYDLRSSHEMDVNEGLVTDPSVIARTGYRLGDSLRMGGEVVLWVPGIDLKLLAAYAPKKIPWIVAASAGFRWDDSLRLVQDPDRLSPGDRLALGVSSFNACLLGLGTSARIWNLELIGELTWDILVGGGAPQATSSPMRADAGLRYHVVRSVQLEALAEIAVNKRPDISASGALMPVEPRFGFLAGVRYFLNMSKRERKVGAPRAEPKETVQAPRLAEVQGQLLDPDGDPIADARVRLSAGDRTLETATDAQGVYRLEAVPAGPARLEARAEGFEELDWTVTVEAGMPALEPRRLAPVAAASPAAGGQLRGLVRAFSGKPLQAKVKLQPSGKEASTDANGFFQIDVPPGTYRVLVRAPGYRRQTRKIQVEPNGVSIINVDMREVGK